MAIAFGAAVGLFLLGFVIFANQVQMPEKLATPPADGIIALTGGEKRIAHALELMASGKAKRVLITGVHPSTSKRLLKRLLPQKARLFECCIDLDYMARDTIGNARAAQSWVQVQDYRSLIIVTSSYHMPRSLIELRAVLPGIELQPHPVPARDFHADRWWSYPGTFKLLASEYLKLFPSMARFCTKRLGFMLGFEPKPAPSLNTPPARPSKTRLNEAQTSALQ